MGNQLEHYRTDPAVAHLIRNILGCDWGHKVGLPGDRQPCADRAVQRMVLHDQTLPDGPWIYQVQLCARHRDVVTGHTDPHNQPDKTVT